jgi:hypothetical protein
MTQNDDHLRLLSIFHYVVGGLAALFSLLPLFHLVLGISFLVAPRVFSNQGTPPPAFVGWIFIVMAAIAMAVGLSFAGCVIAAGRCLARRRNYLFCLVVAAVECMFLPFGTVLGVFTLIVLMRESVKPMFEAGKVG